MDPEAASVQEINPELLRFWDRSIKVELLQLPFTLIVRVRDCSSSRTDLQQTRHSSPRVNCQVAFPGVDIKSLGQLAAYIPLHQHENLNLKMCKIQV